MIVEFHPEAAHEFIEAAAYYESTATHLGSRFILAVEATETLISRHNEIDQEIESGFRHFVLAEFTHSIIYSIEPDRIWIVAAAHHKRKPGYWLERVAR